jgi:general secretion pathway protein K
LPLPFYEELFAKLGASNQESRDLALALGDYRDVDQQDSKGGAEPTRYADVGFGPKDGPFQAIEELDQLPGLKEEIYRAAKPLVTVHSLQPGIDPATAPAALRELFDQPAIGPFTGFLASYTGARQSKTFSIDVTARLKNGGLFRRLALVVMIRQPDRPFSFLSWQVPDAQPKPDNPATMQSCVPE